MSLPNHTITSADSSRRDSNVPSGFSQAKPSKRDNPVMIADTAALQSLISARPMDIPLPPGFQVTVYNGGISQHYTLPSETVQITRGSIKYVDHHARYGPQTRFRFQLCHNYLQHKCTKLSECSYIHATVLPKPSEVHLNPFAPRRIGMGGHREEANHSIQDDPRVTDGYELMPAGLFIPISAPATFSGGGADSQAAYRPVVTESSRLFRTRGADELFGLILSNAALATMLSQPHTAMTIAQQHQPNDETVAALLNKARHCAHFQFKRVCNLGVRCQYLHSKDPFVASSRAAVEIAARTAIVNEELNRSSRRDVAAPQPILADPPPTRFVVSYPSGSNEPYLTFNASNTPPPLLAPPSGVQTQTFVQQPQYHHPSTLHPQVVVAHPSFTAATLSPSQFPTAFAPASFLPAGQLPLPSAPINPPTLQPLPPPSATVAFNGSYYVAYQ